VAITAAMPGPTGLAMGGLHPVVAIYSTLLSRAFDQLLMDVALQRQRKLEIVSCPSCGRAQVDVYTLASRVTAALDDFETPLRVAVMGRVVNGPGEAREADLGVASGNGKGQIFVRGQVIKTVPESQIVETPIEETMKLAEAAEPSSPAS
jgi:(E)-4-hydroxy-3-methylbut-2-enyl-diphosphate synthase